MTVAKNLASSGSLTNGKGVDPAATKLHSMDEYKFSEIGTIPEDWEYVQIGVVVDLLTGFPFPSQGYSESGVRLLRGSNVKRGTIDWSDESTEYWPSVMSDIQKYLLKSNDIVIAMDGSLVGRSFAILSEEDVPSLLLQRVARVRSISVEQKYLKFWICSDRFTGHCDTVKTVTAIPHISPSDIKEFTIAIPPTRAEQEAIARALSDADALIEALEQMIEKKRLVKLGAMQDLLSGRMRLLDKRNISWDKCRDSKLPADWRVRKIGDIADVKTGPFGSMLHERDYVRGCLKSNYWRRASINRIIATRTNASLVSGSPS